MVIRKSYSRGLIIVVYIKVDNFNFLYVLL